MTKTIEDLFFYLIFLFDLIVIGCILLKPKEKEITPGLWIILFYALLNSVVNLLSHYLSTKTYYYLLAGFTFAEYLIFSAFIFLHIKSKPFRKLIIVLSICFFIFEIIYHLTGRSPFIDSIPIGIETILIIVYSFYYFYEQIALLEDTFIYSKYHFWIIVGMIVYLGGSFFIYLFASQVSKEERYLIDQVWFLTYLFYIIKNILFTIGIYTYLKSPKHPHPEKLYPYLN